MFSRCDVKSRINPIIDLITKYRDPNSLEEFKNTDEGYYIYVRLLNFLILEHSLSLISSKHSYYLLEVKWAIECLKVLRFPDSDPRICLIITSYTLRIY